MVLALLEGQGGGEVFVGNGTYDVEEPIYLPSMVTFRGSGRATVLRLAPANIEGVILHARACQSTCVADLTCQGVPGSDSLASILLDGCGDCEVRSVHARDFGGYGIVLQGNSFVNKLLHNTTSGNGQAGTALRDNDGKGRGGQYVPNLILGCTSFAERGHGFEIDDSLCTNLVGCQVYQPQGHGFYIRRTANSTCLSGSRVFQGAQNGVLVENAHELNVSSNIICWTRGHGIELNNVVWGTVSANNFIDCGGQSQPRYGIYMHTDTKLMQVTGNAIFNWQGMHPMLNGIYEAEDCANNHVANNTVNYCSGELAECLGKESVASANLGLAAQIPWPRMEPFPAEPLGVEPGDGSHFEKNRQQIADFLELTRR
jgi:hypothetical protein